jgi:hypothetical protein
MTGKHITDLPEEILLQIVELAAERYMSTCGSICLVNKTFRGIGVEVLYRNISYWRFSSTLDLVISTLQAEPDLHRHCEHLYLHLDTPTAVDHANRIIDLLPQTKELLVYETDNEYGSVLCTYLHNASQKLPLLQRLRLDMKLSATSRQLISNLQAMNQLKHLSIIIADSVDSRLTSITLLKASNIDLGK